MSGRRLVPALVAAVLLSSAGGSAARAEQPKADAAVSVKALKRQVVALKRQVRRLQDRADRLEVQRDDARIERDSLKAQVAGLNSQVAGLTGQVSDLNGKLSAANGSIGGLQTDNANLRAGLPAAVAAVPFSELWTKLFYPIRDRPDVCGSFYTS